MHTEMERITEIINQHNWEDSLSPATRKVWHRIQAKSRRLFDEGRAREAVEAAERVIDTLKIN